MQWGGDARAYRAKREDGEGEQVDKRHGAAYMCVVDAEQLHVVKAGQEGDRRRFVVVSG